MRRRAQITAMLLLAGLLVLPVVLLGTPVGARWALGYAQTRLPVDARGVSGSLWRGLVITMFRYNGDGVNVRARDLSVAVRWRCALESILCVTRFTAERVTVEVSGAGAGTGTGRTQVPDALPLSGIPRIDLDLVSIRELVFASPTAREALRDLELSGRLGPRQIQVERLAAQHALAGVEVRGQLRRSGSLTLNSTVSLADAVVTPDGVVLPRSYLVQVAGDLKHLRGRVDGEDMSPLGLDFEARLPKADSTFLVGGELRGLAVLMPGLAAQPWAQLEGPMTFAARMDGDVRSLRIAQALAGYAPGPLMLSATLAGAGDSWTLADAGLGDAASPVLKAQGPLGTLDALAPALRVVARDFTPPAAAGLPVQQIDGDVSLGFAVADVARSWYLRAERLRVSEGVSTWEVQADLRAADDSVLPRGTISGARDDIEFAYTRGGEAGAPAQMRLPRGLQSDDYALEELALTIQPGDMMQIALQARGDLDGALDVALQESTTGADFRLAPFALSVLNEPVRSEQVIRGRWDRAAAALHLDDFCLAWKRNEACGRHVRLAQSGALDLNLAIDEQLSGTVAAKPYALRALGQGRLDLSWTRDGVERADAALDLRELSVDPFVGSGTAEALRWEQARATGSWTASERSLSLDLQSERLGSLDLAVQERGEALDGSLDVAGLNLGAFDDLLPEWSLDGGRLSSELRLAGSRREPALYGSIRADQLRAQLPGLETPLVDASLAIDAQGTRAAIRGDAMLGGGPIHLQGVCCDGGQLVAQLTGEHNRVAMAAGLDARVSPALEISVDPKHLSVSGLLTVHDGVLTHSGAVGGGVALSDDVYRIDVPPQPRQRFTLSAQLRTLIEPGFSLRSRELLATLAGDLRLDLAPEQPAALFGNLQVLGGELRAYGQALRLTEGVVGFVGDPLNPELNLSAEREIRAEDQRVGFHVRGSLEEPALELFSDPLLPERDTLSYLLRGRGPDVGASADSTAMALSLGASAINQTGLLSSLNAIPGLSGVTVGAQGSEDDTAATISAYVGDRLYLSYGLGIYEPVNALTARLYLRSRLWLEVVSRLESSLDLYYRFDRN